MFNYTVGGRPLPKHLTTDYVPLLHFHRRLANPRILKVGEIKSAPYAPFSHPFAELLIGAIRDDYSDRAFFWNAMDLTHKLGTFRDYFT